jgi:ribosome maturation factor RimP
MEDESSVAQVRAVALPILEAHGMDVVELTCRPQGGQAQIRLLVDRPGGVTLAQCAQVNRLLNQALEHVPLLSGGFTLEVSSPGADRPLAQPRDFERALGEELRVEFRQPAGAPRAVQGILLAVQGDAIVVKNDDGIVTVPLADLCWAKKALRW